MTNEEYRRRVYEVHGDEYDLSELEFKSWDDDVTIICKIHGRKQINARALLYKKHGCNECRGRHISEAKRMKTDEFVERAKKIHGDNFTFEHTDLNDRDEKGRIIVTCKVHGDIRMLPDSILSGHGCRLCADEENSRRYAKPLEKFIEEAIVVHGDDYIYDRCHETYKNSSTPVFIGCKKHGYFPQTPNKHLSGQGCPFCSESRLEREIRLLLTGNNIKFDYDKSKSWLKGQRLDFYLPEYNIGIECQGIQHFEPREHFGEKGGYERIIKMDELKREKCKQNGTKLLYYTDLKEYINEYENIYINKDDLLKEIFSNDNNR